MAALKSYLRDAGLRTTGLKAELLERVQRHAQVPVRGLVVSSNSIRQCLFTLIPPVLAANKLSHGCPSVLLRFLAPSVPMILLAAATKGLVLARI